MGLRETQTRLADWIRAPEGVGRAIEEATSPERERAALGRLVRSDARRAAESRLGIYANAYFYRLLGVLEEDYAALRALLGDPRFNDLVTSYLLVRPPRRPSIRHAGEGLPDFLAEHEAAAAFRDRAPWSSELAALEWARVDVFDAADAPLLRRERVSSLAPEGFGELALRLGGWVRRLRFTHAVDRLHTTALGGEEPREEEPTDATIPVLVWRREDWPRHRRLDAEEAGAIETIADGLSFGELCEWAAGRHGEHEAPGLAAAWLERWLDDGLLIDPFEVDRAGRGPLAD